MDEHPDLDDAAGLLAADVTGSLRSAAMAGAQLRAAREAVGAGHLRALAGVDPRAVVLLGGPGVGARACRQVAALVGGSAALVSPPSFSPAAVSGTLAVGFPVVTVAAAPQWLGPLDVLVVCTDDAGDPIPAAAVSLARRRGAAVVLVAPRAGLLLDTARADDASWLPPLPLVPEAASFVRHVAAALAVLGVLDGRELLPADGPDLVDEAAVRCRPDVVGFANPAKSTTAAMAGRLSIFTAADPVFRTLADHAAATCMRAGLSAAAHDLPDLQVAAAARGPSVPADDLFHDPQIDGPRVAGPRILGLAGSVDEAVERAVRALGGALLVADADLVDPATAEDAAGGWGTGRGDGASRIPTGYRGPDEPVADERPDGRGTDVVTRVVLLAQRLEMAVAYARLAGVG